MRPVSIAARTAAALAVGLACIAPAAAGTPLGPIPPQAPRLLATYDASLFGAYGNYDLSHQTVLTGQVVRWTLGPFMGGMGFVELLAFNPGRTDYLRDANGAPAVWVVGFHTPVSAGLNATMVPPGSIVTIAFVQHRDGASIGLFDGPGRGRLSLCPGTLVAATVQDCASVAGSRTFTDG